MPTPLQNLILNEIKLSKYEQAKQLVKPMVIAGGERFGLHEVIDKMVRTLGIKDSTAETYYHRIMRDLGLADKDPDEESEDGIEDDENDLGGMGSEDGEAFDAPDNEEDDIMAGIPELHDGEFVVDDNPDRQGVIRTVKNAHLVYKRENESGLYDELWIYNTDQQIGNSIEIKRNILAGTDIPPRSTTSDDGTQSYSLSVLGDVQFLSIKNLPQ